MEEKNQPTDTLQGIKDIRRIMERSSRFISLSGLSGIAAGTFALIGAWAAYKFLYNYYNPVSGKWSYTGTEFHKLKLHLFFLAAVVFTAAFICSKRLFWNMIIPLLAGAGFVTGMLRYDDWSYVAPACLIFYGLALINASKYTLTDVRYLGYCEILLGLANMFYIGSGLFFWAAGFGVLHILYGAIMWFKYEKN
jgi:hypothetical protein